MAEWFRTRNISVPVHRLADVPPQENALRCIFLLHGARLACSTQMALSFGEKLKAALVPTGFERTVRWLRAGGFMPKTYYVTDYNRMSGSALFEGDAGAVNEGSRSGSGSLLEIVGSGIGNQRASA